MELNVYYSSEVERRHTRVEVAGSIPASTITGVYVFKEDSMQKIMSLADVALTFDTDVKTFRSTLKFVEIVPYTNEQGEEYVDAELFFELHLRVLAFRKTVSPFFSDEHKLNFEVEE